MKAYFKYKGEFMRRLLGILVFLVFFTGAMNCHAAVGDCVGNIYSTDIKAYINDIPVKAYNIGGRTCVAIEEVTTAYAYNDKFRTLLVSSLAPEYLMQDRSFSENLSVGEIVGDIYSTDIKTFFYDKEIPSYNIGGKTCVAIEDIGNDNDFSIVGGKYIWNPENRTISLEYLYDNKHDLVDIQNKYKYGIEIENSIATFVSDPVSPEWITTDLSAMYDTYIEREENVLPIYYMSYSEESIIGYNFYSENKYYQYSDNLSPSIEEMVYTFNYFYKDKIEEFMIAKGKADFDRTTVIERYLQSVMTDIIERYDTQEYSFLYLSQPTPHGKNEFLLYVREDGSYENINSRLNLGGKRTISFKDLNIDKENETVTFSINEVKGKYIFDMKNCEVKNI